MTIITCNIKDSLGSPLAGYVRVVADYVIPQDNGSVTVPIANQVNLVNGQASLNVTASEIAKVTYLFEVWQKTVDVEGLAWSFRATVPDSPTPIALADLQATGLTKDALDSSILTVTRRLLASDIFWSQLKNGTLNFKGNYSATAFYRRGDAVVFNGSSYVQTSDEIVQNKLPIDNPGIWLMFAAKGEVAQSVQGDNEVYNATTWVNDLDAPTKNTLRNHLETLAPKSGAVLANPTISTTLLDTDNSKSIPYTSWVRALCDTYRGLSAADFTAGLNTKLNLSNPSVATGMSVSGAMSLGSTLAVTGAASLNGGATTLTPVATANSTQVVTAAWVRANLGAALDAAQTITNGWTFSGSTALSGGATVLTPAAAAVGSEVVNASWVRANVAAMFSGNSTVGGGWTFTGRPVFNAGATVSPPIAAAAGNEVPSASWVRGTVNSLLDTAQSITGAWSFTPSVALNGGASVPAPIAAAAGNEVVNASWVRARNTENATAARAYTNDRALVPFRNYVQVSGSSIALTAGVWVTLMYIDVTVTANNNGALLIGCATMLNGSAQALDLNIRLGLVGGGNTGRQVDVAAPGNLASISIQELFTKFAAAGTYRLNLDVMCGSTSTWSVEGASCWLRAIILN